MSFLVNFWLLVTLALLPQCQVVALSEVLSPPELAGVKFEAVVYESSPSANFESITLKWYAPASSADLCSEATMAVQASSNNEALIFSGSDDLRCFPERVAQVAKAKGFSAVIWRNPFSRPGFSASSVWGANTAPIPIFDVVFSSALQFNVTATVKLVPMESPYRGMHWFAPQVPLRFLLISLHLVQLFVCTRALIHQIPTVEIPKDLSTAHAILLFGVIGALIEILYNIDFMGQAHFFPLPMWFGLFIWGYVFNFANTFLIAKAILSAEAAVRGLRFERNHNILLNIAFGSFMLVIAVASILLGWDVYYTATITAVLNSLFILFQTIVGVHFILTQRRVLKILKENAKNRDDAIETIKNLERMSFFMFISGFFMIAFCLSSMTPVFNLQSVQVIVISALVANVFNALTGLAQIFSLPKKVTGIDYSKLAQRFYKDDQAMRTSSLFRARSSTPSEQQSPGRLSQQPIPNGSSASPVETI
jgi:hypothetical protein